MTTTRNRAHHLGLKLQDKEGKNHVNTLHRERAGGRKTGTATRRNDFVRLFSTLTFERTVRPVPVRLQEVVSVAVVHKRTI